jgi:hypothetical protein
MHATLHQNDVDSLVENRMYLAQDRISDLYATARELHVGHRDVSERTGLVTRTRWTIGRHLVSIGQGDHLWPPSKPA